MQLILWIFGFSLLVISVSSTPCKSVEGNWYNKLGSELILSKDENGKLKGEFRTAVEAHEGAAGKSYAIVRGVSSKDSLSHVVGFSAIFNEGTSAASWIGECQKCDGVEELQTTWILKSQTKKCSDHWKSFLINEDVFRRSVSASGPRKEKGENTPKRSSDVKEEETEETISSTAGNGNKVRYNLEGKWYTNDGYELEIGEVSNGTLNGKLILGDSKEINVSGNLNESKVDGVFSLSGVREIKNTVDVWVGQYHECSDGKKMLDMSNLQMSSGTSCGLTRAPVGFKRMIFTRVAPNQNSEKKWSGFSNFANKVSSFFSNLVMK